MGLFGSSGDEMSAQDRVDLAALRDRVARLEATVGQLQSQLVLLQQGQASAYAGPIGAPGAPGAPGATGVAATPVAPADPPWLSEVRELKARGKLINAIKVYRENTGVDLRTAKETVEAMP